MASASAASAAAAALFPSGALANFGKKMEEEVKVPKFETAAAVAAIIVNLQTHKFLLCFGERERERGKKKERESK